MLHRVFASHTPRKQSLALFEPRLRRKLRTLGLVGHGLRYLAYLDPTGYGYVLHDNIYDFWSSLCLSSELRSERRSDVAIFHGWNNHCLFSLGKAKKRGIVTVVERASAHPLAEKQILENQYGKLSVNPPKIPKAQLKKSVREIEEADYVLVPSNFAYKTHIEQGISKDKLAIIPFGVNLEKFKTMNNPRQRRRAGPLAGVGLWPKQSAISNEFVVLFVGQVTIRKGAHHLLQAWQQLELKNAELWLVGNIDKSFKKLDIYSNVRKSDSVKFLGFRRDVPDLMKKASLFAFPSLSEGSALVNYEAMASGLPVITTYNAGSVVEDGKNGFIISVGDVNALSEKIQFFYNNRKEAVEMGKEGRKTVSQYTWDNYGNKLASFYRKIAEKKRL